MYGHIAVYFSRAFLKMSLLNTEDFTALFEKLNNIEILHSLGFKGEELQDKVDWMDKWYETSNNSSLPISFFEKLLDGEQPDLPSPPVEFKRPLNLCYMDFHYAANGKFKLTQKLRGKIHNFFVKRDYPGVWSSFDAIKKDEGVQVFLIGQCPLHQREHKNNRCAFFIYRTAKKYYYALMCNSLPRLRRSLF